MNHFLETLNHPADAFASKNKTTAWMIVGITLLLNAVLEPALQFFVRASDVNFLQMLKVVLFGILMYIAVCAELWVVCKIFGSELTFMDHLISWGATFVPTTICVIVVSFTEVFFEIFWNGTIWGMIFSFVFLGILIWKAILYFIYLRSYSKLSGWRLAGASVVFGIIILFMAALNGYLGVKTPMI